MREHAERLEFSVEVRFVARHGDRWLVELAAILHNKGLVRYSTNELTFDFRCIYVDDDVEPAAEFGGQIRIPHMLVDGSWLPSGWQSTLIEPGLSTRYSYIAAVPERAVAVLLHGRFRYEVGAEGRATHTAEIFQAVPSTG